MKEPYNKVNITIDKIFYSIFTVLTFIFLLPVYLLIALFALIQRPRANKDDAEQEERTKPKADHAAKAKWRGLK